MSTSAPSSLQLRIASVFILLAMSFSIGSFVAVQWMVLPAFSQLEQEEAKGDITHVKELLNTELQAIANFSRHYSFSNEVHESLSGGSQAYPELNIHPDTWGDVEIDLMLLARESGELVWGKIIDPKTGEENALHARAEPLTSRGRAFLRRNGKLGEVRGIVEGKQGLFLVVLQPVYRADGSGLRAGFVLAGRLLTPARRDFLSERVGVDFSLMPVEQESPAVHPTVPGATATYHASQPINYQYEPDTVVSTQRLRDVFNQYTLELETKTPRMITNIGSGIQRLSFAFLTIMSSLFVLLTWLSIRWLVVDPIRSLKQHMSSIRSTGDLSLVLDLGREDELGELAREFGYMQRALGEAHIKLEGARDDALLVANRKSEFLASMSHEIRTPMNGVVGMTELLLETDLNQAQKHLVDTIKTSSSTLVRVVNDVLDFSQIGTGKIQLNEKLFSISSLLREVNAVVAESAHRKGLEYITIEVDQFPSGFVGDDRRIRQVLVNLIGNAIKFTQTGQVVLSISCERMWWEKEVEMAVLKFNVADTGVGLTPVQREEILAQVGQVDSSSTREYSGVGLGLAISRDLVGLMNGEIGLESSTGRGSEFWFTLPLGVERSVDLVDLTFERRDGVLNEKKVLIVDDNVTNCDVLLSHTAQWGCHSEAVNSGADAISVLERDAKTGDGYDILILDSQMPQMSGTQLAEAVTRDSRFGSPLIVMLSSMAQTLSQHDLAALGISCYLAKPVLKNDLYIQIARALEAQPLQKASDRFLPGPIERYTEKPQQWQGLKVKFDADVLVAEDNPVNQQLIEMVLQGFGCRCVLVDNGEKVLKALKMQTYDLVIMDCQMPVMDGFEATGKIRDIGALSTTGERLPILALTANAMEGDKERCLDVGMDDYVSKPFSSEALGEAIEKLLGQKSESTSTRDDHSLIVNIDQESLDRVRQMQREGQPDILTRLIDVYLNSSPDLVEKLSIANDQNDLAAIELAAHTLKSSSANLGALEFSALCGEAEAAARAGGSDTLSAQCQTIISNFETVCEALRKERKNEE